QFLDNTLSASGNKHALIVLHHPPVSIGSPWMDKMGLKNPADLFSVLERHEQVRAVIWGHIHQEFSGSHGDIRLLATPSTCVQFKPGAGEYEKDPLAPGYRVLKLYNSGTIESHIVRVPPVARNMDNQ
ncbi:MAG TPA: phosphodiesterase, partial [Gammaproteobacteria bacterium]|nr:phosphodiesterase [Gammaproteobacteria bacterium]